MTPKSEISIAQEEVELPALVITKGGATFSPRAMCWNFRDELMQIDLDFSLVASIGLTLLNEFKATLIWYAERRSASHLRNMFERMRHMFDGQAEAFLSTDSITPAIYLNYRDSLDHLNEWYAGQVAGFLRRWYSLGYAGVQENLIELLDGLSHKGNEKGRAVLTLDSYDGPLSELEYQFCWEVLRNAYATQEISLQTYVLLGLCMAIAPRPVQLAALRVCDVHTLTRSDGSLEYYLDVPRAKNRLETRAESKYRVVNKELGCAALSLASQIRVRFATFTPDPSQAPLFPLRRSVDAPVGYEYHSEAKRITNLIRSGWRTVLGRNVSLHMTALRLRRTLGTRAAQEGYGALVIAELLDHTDTQNVLVYSQATPDIAMRIDRAMASELAALANAFRGRVIEGEHQATRGNDPASRIVDLRIDPSSDPMGSCAKRGPCGLLAPVACYTCHRFEAWIDGPHEAVIHWMLGERQRMIDEGEPRIATALDLQIVAAAEVADRCAAIRAELAHG